MPQPDFSPQQAAPQPGFYPQDQAYLPPKQGNPPSVVENNAPQPSITFQETTVVIQAVGGRRFGPVTRPECFIMSILACVFCFPPTGIFAIYYAYRSKELLAAGDKDESLRLALSARILVIISIVFGFAWIASIVFYEIFGRVISDF